MFKFAKICEVENFLKIAILLEMCQTFATANFRRNRVVRQLLKTCNVEPATEIKQFKTFLTYQID